MCVCLDIIYGKISGVYNIVVHRVQVAQARQRVLGPAITSLKVRNQSYHCIINFKHCSSLAFVSLSSLPKKGLWLNGDGSSHFAYEVQVALVLYYLSVFRPVTVSL